MAKYFLINRKMTGTSLGKSNRVFKQPARVPGLNDIRLALAAPDQYPAIYGIMALAGEHMHRVLKLSHWHPFPSSEQFMPHLEGRAVYAVYAADLLVGTFNLGTLPEPYYREDMSAFWQDVSAPAMYFSSFALLPSHQQQGIGSWCMAQADLLAQAAGYRYLRFDGVANHEKLIRFYSRLGYRQCGHLLVRGEIAVMCFEKDFSRPGNPAHDD
jgi:GNAT superfamily N-acetyltransferase